MRTSVDTPELHTAAAVHEDTAEAVGALAAALSQQAAAAGSWSSGELRGAVERFFTTLAWASTTGAAELSGLAERLRASADGYDRIEAAVLGQQAAGSRTGDGG